MPNRITAEQTGELARLLRQHGVDGDQFQQGIVERPLQVAQFIFDAVNPYKTTRTLKIRGELTFPPLAQQAAALMEAIPGLQATWPEAMAEAKLPDGADGLALLPRPNTLLQAKYDNLSPEESYDDGGASVRLARLASHAARSFENSFQLRSLTCPLFMREPHDRLGIGLPTPKKGQGSEYSCFAIPVSLGIGRSEHYTLEDMRYTINHSSSPRLVGLGVFQVLCMMIAIPELDISEAGIGCPGSAYMKMPYVQVIGGGDQRYLKCFSIQCYKCPYTEERTLVISDDRQDPCDWAVAILPE